MPTAAADMTGQHSGEGAPGATRGLLARWRHRGAPESGHRTLVDRVLAARGIGPGSAGAFLQPALSQLHDPSMMPDLDRAAERILEAARAREPIVIYGDYDVDGVSATAILFHTIRAVAPDADLRTYVPHRLEEGYGLNANAIAELCDQGARVIVSVDCGVTAVAPARVARDRGVDLIITDHHNPPEHESDLPLAFAVVHPRRPGSAYPFGDLCGAGVAYKLAWRLATLHSGGGRASPELRTLLLDMLALAALGVIADVVPLLGENRVIARFGLARIKSSPLIGLRALVAASGLAGERVNAEDVGFKLAPRLNACGRMGHARDAVELFTVAGAARAEEIAAMLCGQNDERRATERAIFEQASAMADAGGFTRPDRRAIVLAHEGWHAGVVGIVCSRLVERFHRPTLLMQRRDGMCHGSGRSIDGFSLHAGLVACADLLESFGGHDMAAGLKLREDRLDAFTERFVAHANDHLSEADLIPWEDHDADAEVPELTREAVDALAALGPFGRENPEVVLRLRGLRVRRAEAMGAGGRHLSMRVTGPGSERTFRLVGWNWGDRLASLREGMTLDALAVPGLNAWNGSVTVEGTLRDVAPVRS